MTDGFMVDHEDTERKVTLNRRMSFALVAVPLHLADLKLL